MKSLRFSPVSLLAAISFLGLVAATAQTSDDPAAIVKKLYGVQNSGSAVFNQATDRAAIDRFFGKDLATMIWNDAVSAKGEVGALDFDPLYGSQDPQVKDFTIMDTGWGGDKKFGGENEAVVQVTFRDSGVKRLVSFQFERNADEAWNIRDIRYPDGRTLAAILAAAADTSATAEDTEPPKTTTKSAAGAAKSAASGGVPYQVIDGTTSPDSHYALAWGIRGVPELYKFITTGADVDEEKVENYIVDPKAHKIVTTLADAQHWVNEKGNSVRGTQLTAAWATPKFVLVDYNGKRANVFVRAMKLDGNKVAGELDVAQSLENSVRAYLASKFAAKYKRAKDSLLFFYNDPVAEGENSWAITAITDLVKTADEADRIDVKVRVRFFIEGADDSLKFTLLTADKAK